MAEMTLNDVAVDMRAYSLENGASFSANECAQIARLIDAAIKQRERDAKDGEDSKDGARYRHMIETSPFMCFGASEYRCKADLDEAIDAAMAKESGNE